MKNKSKITVAKFLRLNVHYLKFTKQTAEADT